MQVVRELEKQRLVNVEGASDEGDEHEQGRRRYDQHLLSKRVACLDTGHPFTTQALW